MPADLLSDSLLSYKQYRYDIPEYHCILSVRSFPLLHGMHRPDVLPETDPAEEYSRMHRLR